MPVCVDPRPRVMRGIGEILSEPLRIPRFAAVLVNPGVAVPTKDVFAHARIARAASPSLRRKRAAFRAGEPHSWRT